MVLDGLKSGNIAETCRKRGIRAEPCCRWNDEVEQRGLTSASLQPDFSKVASHPQ